MIRPALSNGFEDLLRAFPAGMRAGIDTAKALEIREAEGGRVSASLSCADGVIDFPAPSLSLVLALLAFACPPSLIVETPEAFGIFEGQSNMTDAGTMHAFFQEGGKA